MSNPHNPAQSDASVEHDPNGTMLNPAFDALAAADFDRFPTEGQPREPWESPWDLNRVPARSFRL